MPPVKKTPGTKVAKPVVKKASASKPKPKKVSAPKKVSTKTPTPAPVEQEIIAPPVAPTTELTVYSD